MRKKEEIVAGALVFLFHGLVAIIELKKPNG